MKRAFFLALLVGVPLMGARSQSPFQPAVPGQGPATPVTPQTPGQPGQPGTPAPGTPVGPVDNQGFFTSGVTSRVNGAGNNLSSRFGSFTNPMAMSNFFQSGEATVADAQALLTDLQGSIEQALPVISMLTSGGAGVDPATGLPNQIVNSVATGRNQQSFIGTLGPNRFVIDAQTYHSLIILQNSLRQTLPALQRLTTSTPLDANGGVNPNTGQTLTPTGLTNQLVPLTNNMYRQRIPHPAVPRAPMYPQQPVPQNRTVQPAR